MNSSFCQIAAAFAVLVVGTVGSAGADDSLTVTNLTVKLIEQREVPARDTGLLVEVSVREGSEVTRGQMLGKLDDRKSRLEEKLAESELIISTKRAQNYHALALAQKDYDQQQELEEQQKLLSDIAHRKAENQVRVLAAEKSSAVAKNELARATRARQEFADSVSISEIDGLRLTHERSELEAQQAQFERQIDALTAKSEDRASRMQAISVQQSKIAVQQAGLDQEIAGHQSDASEHKAELAALAVRRHQIISPIDGVVVQRYKHPGEWVTAGDPIVRVIHLKRLRAEGFVRTQQAKQLQLNRQVTLVRQTEGGERIVRQGKVVFVSPEVDPVNDEVAFWIEFDNPDQSISPGMQMTMTIGKP